MSRAISPMVNKVRMDDGGLPWYTFPGCYPLVYITSEDSSVACPKCANNIDNDPDDWVRLVDVGVHWEGPPMTCDHCESSIESAYGDPDEDEEEAE